MNSIVHFEISADDIQEIPGVGKLCYCLDTEGNHIGLMQWTPCDKTK